MQRLQGSYARLIGATIRLSNQDLVVDLMYSERYVIHGKLCLLARGFQLGLGHIVCRLDLQQRGQWLGELSPAGRQVDPSLVDDDVRRRNRRSPWYAQAAGEDLNQLRLRQMQKAAVVMNGGEIRTLGNRLRLLFLLDRVSGDADPVVTLKSQLNGFLQCDVARRRDVACFLGQGEGGGEGRRHQ